MHTERFRSLRKEAIEKMLDKNFISKVWRNIVKKQLRLSDIKDLYDHYDFNYNIEERALALKNDIIEGTYSVSTPLIYRMEKKFGVCRHLVIPQPTDALLLQVLIESIADKILKKQPSNNSFYSRDKHNVKKPHQGVDYELSFISQWKKLQKKIYKFKEDKNLLIVTDVSNYYDSINLDELRKVFVSYVETDEVVVDLLFKIIESISWNPDYLPNYKLGLPTSNIEGIRLLAHLFLFEIDAVVEKKVDETYTRWMDDLTIGIDSKREAIHIISHISDMLKSRGCALNLSKTMILNPDEANYHFQIDKNLYLDSIENINPDDSNAHEIEKKLYSDFKRHFKDQGPKSWSKVTKRYITALSKLESKKLIKLFPDIYLDYPDIRPNLLYYLSSIGYYPSSGKALLKVIKKIDLFDDLSLYYIAYLLTSWKIPRSKSGLEMIDHFDKALFDRAFDQNLSFFSLIWFRSKYYSPDNLLNFLDKYRNKWQSNSFLRRQATACLSRLLVTHEGKARKILNEQALSGVQNTVSLANQILLFSNKHNIENRVRMYLFPPSIKIYHLNRFLVLCSVLNSYHVRQKKDICDKVRNYVDDPTYRFWLKKQYNI